MNSYSMFIPSYSVGGGCYNKISSICSSYGNKVVIIGGKTALLKTEELLKKELLKSGFNILDIQWYGGECTEKNINRLINTNSVKEANMIFAVGGGKAIDTSKIVGDKLNKPVFSIPTISSTCSAASALAVIYSYEGVFSEVYELKEPPKHVFISIDVIAEAPDKYLWAGIGDTLAKHYENEFSSRNSELNHSNELGKAMSVMCCDPLVKYGEKALNDCKNNISSDELKQVVLNIIISTGLVSNLVELDFNSSLAHALCYGLTILKQIEEKHCHGEVVSYGVLILLLVDKQKDEFKKLYEFYRKVKLPTSLEELNVTLEELKVVIDKTLETPDSKRTAYEVNKDMILKAILELEEISKKN